MPSDPPAFDGPPLLSEIVGPPPIEGPGGDPLIGSVLADRYRITSMIGDGGMGSVYLGEHLDLGRQVAIKVLKPEFNHDSSLVERFFREARATAAIQHENVVDIVDFGHTPEYAFFVMEPLSGCELAELLGRGRTLPWARARAIIVQVVRALGAAHAAGIVHRDMKPGNVFLIRRGDNPEFVKVLDFGIAKIDDGVQLTQAGMVFGTAHYMAPEQATGSAQIDGRTDVYAVGCMLFELLSGRLPFPGDNFMKVLGQHIKEPPPPMSEVNPGVELPAGVEELVARALAKRPDDRFPDMAAFERALLAIDGEAPAHTGHHATYAQPHYDHGSSPPTAMLDGYEFGSGDPQPAMTMMMPGMGGASLASLEPPQLAALAWLFVAFAHGTDGVLTNAEMRVLAERLRGWAPQLALDQVGAVLREAVSAYGHEAAKPRRLHDHRTLLAASLPPDRLAVIIDDLREIALADGRFTGAEQEFVFATSRAFGLASESMLESLAFVYLALGHATDGVTDAEEMRVIAEQLRQWAPNGSLQETGEALRRAVAEYKRLAGPGARLDRVRAAAEALQQSTDQDTRRRILADLWRIAGADGHICADEQRFIMDMVARFNS